MMSESYNGWANRETWAVALWLNNEQEWQESVLALVRELVDLHEQEYGAERISPTFVGEQIREWLDNLLDWSNYGDEHGGQRVVPALLLSMLSDIGSLWRVDWHELGTVFLADAAEVSA